MYGDYWGLNVKTKLDSYCMPTPGEIFNKIEGCKYFYVMDMRKSSKIIEDP